jgi:head-tail adaptor
MAKKKGAVSSSGDRTELVTVERLTRTSDGQGGADLTWTAIGQLWGSIEWVSGGERTEGKSDVVRNINKYRVTALAAGIDEISMTAVDRLIWAGDVFNIVDKPYSVAPSLSAFLIETEIP